MGDLANLSVNKLVQYGNQLLDAAVGFVGNLISAALIVYIGFNVNKIRQKKRS